jgi:hypothetical protein
MDNPHRKHNQRMGKRGKRSNQYIDNFISKWQDYKLFLANGYNLKARLLKRTVS